MPITVDSPELQPGKLRWLATWGPWAAVGDGGGDRMFALLTLAAARSRGKALTALGVSALLVGAAGWAGIEVGRRYVDTALNRTTGDIRTVAEVMVGPRRRQPAPVAQHHAGRRRSGWWCSA